MHLILKEQQNTSREGFGNFHFEINSVNLNKVQFSTLVKQVNIWVINYFEYLEYSLLSIYFDAVWVLSFSSYITSLLKLSYLSFLRLGKRQLFNYPAIMSSFYNYYVIKS